jgi:CheY-like chemotaxis protein
MNLTILVVEDDLPSLELMHDVLTNAKAEVVATADSKHAAELINSRRFDGIFLDLRLPGFNGFELTQMTRGSKWNRTTPVIIVSGEGSAAMPKAFACGATFFLAKPFDQRKLMQLFRTTQSAMVLSHTRAARVSLAADVTCTAGHRVVRGMSRDISMSGMLFDAGYGLQQGDRVQMSFKLPGTIRAISATALVVRVDQHGRAGLSFMAMNQEDNLRIRDLITQAAA